MLIRNILEESVRKFDEVKAVKWLKKKEIMERSYGELMENVVSTRKGLLAEGFEGKHIALIGTSSVEWMESYLGIITGCTTAVPLDAALPCEDLIDLLNRSDSAALFLSPKLRPYLDAFLGNCPKLQKVWMLQEEVEDAPAKVYGIGELRNAGKSASADSVCPDAEDIATIIFTSGTTGKSKGVMLTQNNLASNVEAVKITAEPFANIKLLFESQNVKPSLLSSFFVHSRVFMTFAVVSSKYALSFTAAVAASIVILSMVYELNEYFTSFRYLISTGLAMAKPTLEPASERDFENVCTTMTLSYLSMSGSALSPPKSTYASSTTTITS